MQNLMLNRMQFTEVRLDNVCWSYGKITIIDTEFKYPLVASFLLPSFASSFCISSYAEFDAESNAIYRIEIG